MKRILSILALVTSICILFTACKETGGSVSVSKAGTDEASANPAKYTAVKEATMPDLNGVTLTKNEVEEKYRPYTDWRIYQIRTTKTTVQPKDGGTAYYVSPNGDDKADGKSPETAIKSLANIGKLPLKSGDVVYFERGGIWRGQLKANKEGVTYSAYGEGRKPELYASPVNAGKPECWEETEAENVWVYHKSFQECGTVIFNQGEGIGVKAVVENGRNTTNRKPFKDYKDLDENFHFYNYRGKLYVYYDGGNPGEKFGSIELCVSQHGVKASADNITFDNLCIKYAGAHGISSNSCSGLTVTNCEFAFIGGAFQGNSTTRLGNGVEIWGTAKNFTVDNCYFYQMYDTGATFQYSTKSGAADVCENIKFTNSVYDYCNYSIEYFLSSGTADISYIKDFEISGNLCWYAGEGLCFQRPDKTANAHIKSWGHKNYIKGNFDIKNNLFAIASNVLVETIAKNNVPATYDNNIYIQTERKKVGSNGNVSGDRFSAAEVLKVTGDKNAKIITVQRDSNTK